MHVSIELFDSSRLKRTLEIEIFNQIGRWVNVENALCRARCSFPIFSHSWPGRSTCSGFFSRWPNQDCQLFMLFVSFVKCAQTFPFNTTQHISSYPDIPHTMFEMCMLESKHGNAILHMELSTSVVGEGWRKKCRIMVKTRTLASAQGTRLSGEGGLKGNNSRIR